MLVEVWKDITASLCAIENLCQQLYDEYFTLSAKMNTAKEIISHARNSNDKAARTFNQYSEQNRIDK